MTFVRCIDWLISRWGFDQSSNQLSIYTWNWFCIVTPINQSIDHINRCKKLPVSLSCVFLICLLVSYFSRRSFHFLSGGTAGRHCLWQEHIDFFGVKWKDPRPLWPLPVGCLILPRRSRPQSTRGSPRRRRLSSLLRCRLWLCHPRRPWIHPLPRARTTSPDLIRYNMACSLSFELSSLQFWINSSYHGWCHFLQEENWGVINECTRWPMWSIAWLNCHEGRDQSDFIRRGVVDQSKIELAVPCPLPLADCMSRIFYWAIQNHFIDIHAFDVSRMPSGCYRWSHLSTSAFLSVELVISVFSQRAR